MTLGPIQLATFFLSTFLIIALHHHFKKTKPPLHHNHPPTPFSLPILGHLHLLSPLIHRSFHRLSSLHGPLIHLRLGSVPCVVVSTPEYAREFLKTNELNFSTRHDSTAINRLTYNSSFAFAPHGPYWKFIKKLVSHELLANRNLNQFRPIRNRELLCFLQTLTKKAKACEAVNVTEELLKLTNNVISQIMLGIRSSGTKGEADEARTLVREVSRIFGEFNLSDFIWFLKRWDLQGIGKRCEDIYARYDALLEKIIMEREEMRKENGDGKSVKDFLDILVDALENEDSEIKLTRDHVKALILDFFTAATDTSAVALEWALSELINNPKVLKKAQEEVDNVVGKHRLVAESDVPNLPYIQSIVKETFRLHPPIPLLTRSSVQDCVIDGYNIPAHTMLFVNIWSIGRNPKYWENPLDFWPERFLRAGKDDLAGGLIDIKGQHFQLLPFGTGRRGCPGISLALQQLPTVLAATIQCFEWKVAADPKGENINGTDGVVDMTERPGLTAPRANDLVCMPVARMDLLDSLFDP
ncbi:cytochrome P450 93B2-like [Rhododendron vialii]|uniref:cytochrome P450 93B2-like n=1 Tax=Rhododendron vialii TaxID=182163 RepID=UPI00265E04C0|nr:cytochrome P450 93B2-like [Rhododendron vialii]